MKSSPTTALSTVMKETVVNEPSAVIASAGSRQFSRRHSGPPNPKDRPGQKPGATVPSNNETSTDTKTEMLAKARLADLAEIADRIRARIKRTTADAIATGKDLLVAQQRLGSGDVLDWVERELGMTRRWAQLQMMVAKTFGEIGEIISSVPPTTIYKLAAPSTPEFIKGDVIADLRAERTVDHRAVEQRIKASSKTTKKPTDTAMAGADVDHMSDTDLDAEHRHLLGQLRGLYGLFERLQTVEEALWNRHHDSLDLELSKKELKKALAGWSYGGRIIAVLAEVYYDENGFLRPEIAGGRAKP
jgi:hypothetical protein